MNPNAAVVVTTIGDGLFLEGYAENFSDFGHLEHVRAYVIPDKKTPKTLYERVQGLRKRGFDVMCPDISEQEAFLTSVGLPTDFVPYNSDNRRNIGYLMALRDGVDFVISLDDDNYCDPDADCYDKHGIVTAAESRGEMASTDSGWFNICELMTCEPTPIAYARGFPYAQRHKPARPVFSEVVAPVRLNAGLWLSEPDMDAISWLVNPTRTAALRRQRVLLGNSSWTPINTQNTALHRDLLPAYYFLRMGYPLAGVAIDRYGDIFSGYFVEKCVHAIGHVMAAGEPAAIHRRNKHNYMSDAWNEWGCVLVLEDLLPWLTDLEGLDGSDYCAAYESLSVAIQDAVEQMTGRIWTDATRGYFHQMAYYMRQWLRACRVLM